MFNDKMYSRSTIRAEKLCLFISTIKWNSIRRAKRPSTIFCTFFVDTTITTDTHTHFPSLWRVSPPRFQYKTITNVHLTEDVYVFIHSVIDFIFMCSHRACTTVVANVCCLLPSLLLFMQNSHIIDNPTYGPRFFPHLFFSNYYFSPICFFFFAKTIK